MQCSRHSFWSLSSTSWEGNSDTGDGIEPKSSWVICTEGNVALMMVFVLFKRPTSSRYCRRPLLNNLTASIALSFIASGKSPKHKSSDHKQEKRIKTDITSTVLIGFSVIFTLIDPVPQSLWASYHVFGLLTCGQGLCTAILTLTAAACVRKETVMLSLSSTEELQHQNDLYMHIHRPKPPPSCTTCPSL